MGEFRGLIVWFNKPLSRSDGVISLFSNQNYTGFWFSVLLPFIVSLINYYKKFNYKKFTLIIIFLSSVYFLLLTNSRNAILGFALSGIIIFGIKKLVIILLILFSLISIINFLSYIVLGLDINLVRFFLNEGLLNK